MIKSVTGLSWKEGPRVDEKREVRRMGAKKAASVTLLRSQADALRTLAGDTAQDRRDAVLMCLLLDHGLRVGELARLRVGDIRLGEGMMVFYRPKVAKIQRHRLSALTAAALARYMADLGGDDGSLLRRSTRSGQLLEGSMSERSITERVRVLGERIGVQGLSAHDCRHFWATWAVKLKTDPFTLMQAGGWTSMQTVKRYVDDQVVANEGVRVG
jgi:integrase